MKKIVWLLLIVSVNVFAQDEIVTDRPDVTESALTIPFKSFQFETGVTYLEENNIDNFTLPEFLIRVGVLKFLELRVENSFYKANNQINNSDLFLGLKAQLLKKNRFNIALLSHVNLPENNRGDLLLIGKVLLSYVINDKSEIGVNIGLADMNKDNDGQFVYSIAYGRGLTDRLGFFVENFGSLPNGDDFISFVDGGFSYLLKSKIQLDVKVGMNTSTFDNYFVGAGVSFRAFN